MDRTDYDIIVIGAGSGGLGISLFMSKAGLKTLLIDKSDEHIGGDCLNNGCVPSKALIHVSRILHAAKKAERFGYVILGKPDIQRAAAYVLAKQNVIRTHENAAFLRSQGMDVVLGTACFYSANSVQVNGELYSARKIVLATGSRPASLKIPGIETVVQYNNNSIFQIDHLPERILIVGGGPIGVEIGQALSRLGSKVTIVHRGENILPRDEKEITSILLDKLREEGIVFHLQATVKEFTSSREALISKKDGSSVPISFDAVFVAIGRRLELEELRLEKAGIRIEDGKIIVNAYLQTTNKRVFTCGDISGSLMLSHVAEQHARLLLNNFFSPFKKKLKNTHMSWATFTDPEVVSFGMQGKELQKKRIGFKKLEMNFNEDDRAVVDDYQYGKLILFVTRGGFLKKESILGGSLVAPQAGEIAQELILANMKGLSINDIFNKIYPYPVASRVNQMIIVQYKDKQLTGTLKKVLRWLFRIM
ncbi:MAG TPA: NAD(P)/FAD-dependent oxidoreductase [Mucilaginibacter sp.]|jgi:pyruvate/2-oxoglutarate dehydrogenase complex dihydrolipoamide dehydrogenase (E3) component